MRVGVFDSGLGGLTILKSLIQSEPFLDYTYLADSSNAPYGPRSFDNILELTTKAVNFLFKKDCQIIILACNTASAKALRTIQQNWLPQNFPQQRVLGVIRPSVEYIKDNIATRKIAIWATSGTVVSGSYIMELKKINIQENIFQLACPKLVPHIETGTADKSIMHNIISDYWKATLDLSNNIDTLLLGCTHFPILFEQIKKVIPQNIQVIHQGKILGAKWKNYLTRHPEHLNLLSKNKTCEFFATGPSNVMQKEIKNILGIETKIKEATL